MDEKMLSTLVLILMNRLEYHNLEISIEILNYINSQYEIDISYNKISQKIKIVTYEKEKTNE